MVTGPKGDMVEAIRIRPTPPKGKAQQPEQPEEQPS
jgi:hypothetical protein